MQQRNPLRVTALALIRAADAVTAVLFALVAPLVCLLSRLSSRRTDVGLGPEPLINNVYHARALESAGYSAETFVDQVFHITDDFDYRADLAIPKALFFLRGYWLFFRAIFRYRLLFIYFNGGPLMSKPWVWRLEPILYRLAGVRTLVTAYGADVQDLTRSPNLLFKHAMSIDYPDQQGRMRRRVDRQIDLWTRWADHIIAGVEWVDYLPHWDTLMLGHFSIDTDTIRPAVHAPAGGPLRILHAPNHRAVKGTDHFMRAVEELRAEGVDVELVMLERVPNDLVLQAIAQSDVVADQLIVGWYAMFALEAMAMEKPVLCYLRPDLVRLYEDAALVAPGEIPIVDAAPLTVKDAIRALAADRSRLPEIGKRSREFVLAHHSLGYVGGVFGGILAALGIAPRHPA